MSTRKELEERKAKAKEKLVLKINESPIKFIDVKAFNGDEELMLSENLIIKKKDLNNIIYSNKFNVKYSSVNDKITIYLKTPMIPVTIDENDCIVKLDNKNLSSNYVDVNIEFNTKDWIQQ